MFLVYFPLEKPMYGQNLPYNGKITLPSMRSKVHSKTPNKPKDYKAFFTQHAKKVDLRQKCQPSIIYEFDTRVQFPLAPIKSSINIKYLTFFKFFLHIYYIIDRLYIIKIGRILLFENVLNKYVFSWVESSKLKYIFSDKNKPDVILTDKSDIALALKYNIESMIAPIILEKGRNAYAQKLINIGKENKIPIIEDKEFVKELFSALKTGQTILYKYWEKIALIYSKHTNININKKNIYFNEIFETQRPQKYELVSLNIPDKINMEVSGNIYSIVKNKYFKINIFGLIIDNIKAEENKKLENDEYHIKVNGLLVKNSKIIYTFIEPFEQLNIYLTECLKQHYKQLIGRDEIVYFLSQIKEKHPVLIDEMIKYYSITEIKKVIHELLEEDVSIQNIITILETMADFGNGEHNFNIILEKIRIAIGKDICYPFLNDNWMRVVFFGLNLEHAINENINNTENVKCLNDKYTKIVHDCISNALPVFKERNIKPVFLCSPVNRKLISDVVRKVDKNIAVISTLEVPKDLIWVEPLMELVQT